jgi:ATP-binding cassette subfamily B protein
VARAAELDEGAFGPSGYDTIAGERGARLSGGQRQRIAIARALIRDPSELVLDEATSSLDPPAAAAINDLIARIALDRTVIFVTHRLEDVVTFDRIFVLGEGKLKECGTHDQLLARNGAYAALWRARS